MMKFVVLACLTVAAFNIGCSALPQQVDADKLHQLADVLNQVNPDDIGASDLHSMDQALDGVLHQLNINVRGNYPQPIPRTERSLSDSPNPINKRSIARDALTRASVSAISKRSLAIKNENNPKIKRAVSNAKRSSSLKKRSLTMASSYAVAKRSLAEKYPSSPIKSQRVGNKRPRPQTSRPKNKVFKKKVNKTGEKKKSEKSKKPKDDRK